MLWIRLGGIFMLLAVALGAFGAHGLRHALDPDARAIYQTAVFYHAIHGLGLMLLGVVSLLRPGAQVLRCAGWAFTAGIILFSGSLYLLSVTGIKRLGMVTPFGGVAFLAGWLWLALAAR